MSHSSGTKVTTDPTSQTNPINEAPGVITSDSLAGESLASGGDFGSTTGAAASSQPSKSTTTNTTDTSGATELAPAPNADARLAEEEWSETRQLNAGREISDKNAVFGERNAGSAATGGSSGSYAAASGGSYGGASGDVAGGASSGGAIGGVASGGIPSTKAASGVAEREAARQGDGRFQPKGANLTEGGFDGNEPNASFSADVGTKNDPSRVALQGLQKADAQQPGVVGGQSQGGVSNDGQYDVLKEASA
ncbi:hypothetical protein BDZ85DRAFT_302744 [Elsinoe ampelina]|uniref:Uncharacterized protein n=1 Tax=Elsinoe ampelina TaxID=302913 RepID=A0A6A6G4E9_9PEZI|nr:hypothetical protein BDZ85DRAFT_302744 [Elsinoe ampelina]